MNRFALTSFLFVCGLSLSPMAVASAKYVWSDAQGLLPQNDCRASTLTILPLYIATKSFEDSKMGVPFRNKTDNLIGTTPARSMVRFLNASEKNHQRYARILNTPQNAQVKNLTNPLAKNSEGYFSEGDLQPIDDYVFEVTSSSEKILAHTFWQVILNGSDYSVFICGNKKDKYSHLSGRRKNTQ